MLLYPRCAAHSDAPSPTPEKRMPKQFSEITQDCVSDNVHSARAKTPVLSFQWLKSVGTHQLQKLALFSSIKKWLQARNHGLLLRLNDLIESPESPHVPIDSTQDRSDESQHADDVHQPRETH